MKLTEFLKILNINNMDLKWFSVNILKYKHNIYRSHKNDLPKKKRIFFFDKGYMH